LDVTQEAFLKAYRALPGFRGESAFYTWMYRIAVNTAKNHLAAQVRRPQEMDSPDPDLEQYEMETGAVDVDTPEHLLLTEEIQNTVIAAIKALPEDLRTAISLRELDGMSYEEIAVAMDCPVGTVRSRIFRAREAIDRDLKPLLTN
jgi:RNA polymerase sigma-70 factor, ECF subfamily